MRAKNEGERVTDEELKKRYGSQLREYARGKSFRPSDDLICDVLVGHMTGFLPHMGGFRDQSEDFQRLTLVLHLEIASAPPPWPDGYSLWGGPAQPEDALRPLEPVTFTLTRETG